MLDLVILRKYEEDVIDVWVFLYDEFIGSPLVWFNVLYILVYEVWISLVAVLLVYSVPWIFEIFKSNATISKSGSSKNGIVY